MTPATNNIIPASALPPQEVVMGMGYDEQAGAWRLDLPCRINGKATHLKDSIYGPQRKMQAAAMRRWLELEEKAKAPEGSLTFGEDCQKYIDENPRLGQGIRSVIQHLQNGLGDTKRRDFKPRFAEWIDLESRRNCQKQRRVDGALKMCDTGKQLSAATLQSYKRYARLIARTNGYGDALDRVVVGRPEIRRRPIEPWEMLQVEDVIQREYPWFYPAFDFARTNPIRPEDQFSLTVELHLRGSRLSYKPGKTYAKTKLMAYPIIWPHQRAWCDTLHSGLIFPRIGGRSMLDGSPYYTSLWKRICKKAGVKNFRYYDLRHHAVTWMRAQGVEDWRIVKAAGWAGLAMLSLYDPDNRHMIEDYDDELLHRRGDVSVLETQREGVLNVDKM